MPMKETGGTAKERIMARAKAMQTTNDRKQTQQETRQQPRQAENPLAGAAGTPLEKMQSLGSLEDQETRQWNQAIGKMSRAQIERLSGTLDSALQGQKKQLAATEQVFNQLHGQNATEGLREQLTQQQARAKKTEERLNQLNAAREQAIFREYEDLRSSGDFAENSGYRTTANGKEAKMHPLTGTYAETGFGDVYYDYINGNQAARDVVLANDTKAGTTHGGWKDLPEETVQLFNYLYATQGKDAAYDYLNRYASRGYTGIETALMGGMQGSGAASAAAALGALTGKLSGDEETRENSREWYGGFLTDAARAKEEHPGAYAAGSMGGSLALMYGIGAAAGAGVQAAGMGAGALSTQAAAGALSFAGANALQNAGAAATGYTRGGDYLRGIAVSGVQGMAGSIAGGLVGSGMASVLRDKGMMTPFMEFVRQTASGMTNAAVNQAVGYAAAEEKPSAEDVATGLATAFAFSVLTGAVNTIRTTQVQKSSMEQAYSAVEKAYKAMLSGTESMTPEGKAQRAQVILEQTQRLRESANSQYIAGQQKAIDELNAALDMIEQAMQSYVNGYRAAYEAAQTPKFMLPGGGSTGTLPTAGDGPSGPADAELARQMEQGLAAAIRQGMTGQERIPGAAQWAAAQAVNIMAPQADTARPEASTDAAPRVSQPAPARSDVSEITKQLTALGEPQQRAEVLARNIQQFVQGKLTDSAAAADMINDPAAQQVLRQITGQKGTEQSAQLPEQSARGGQLQTTERQAPAGVQPRAVLPTAEDGTGRTLPTADTGDIVPDALRDDRLPSGVDSVNAPGYDEAITERRTGYEAAGKDQVSDGDGRRVSGERAGGQSGILAEGGPQRTADPGRAAIERQNTGRNLRLQPISSRELGLENGTQARTVSILPREAWDAELRQTAARVERETGKPVTMVLGRIRITDGAGTERNVRGVYSAAGIIIQADNMRVSPGQIADHEIFHSYAEENPGLIQAVERAIAERYGREEFDGIVARYMKELRGIVNVPEGMTADEFEEAVLDVKNEVLADAYAGINAFGAHAEQYQDVTRETLEERGVVKPGRETAAATDRRTGPPERYSIAELGDGKKYVRADRQVIFGNDPDSWSEQLEDYINGKIRRGEDVTLIGADGDELRLTATSAGKLSDNHTGDGRTMSDEAFERKVNAASHIDELAQVSVRGKKSVRDHFSRHGDMASGGWNYRTAFFEDFDGKYYEVTISVAQNENGNMVYNIGQMQERSIPQIDGSSVTNNGALRGDAPVNSISETGRNVNGKEEPAPQKSAPVKTRFSMDEPVERTKDLIAVHNKDWSVIRDAALNWGGIPSPSVAIVDAAEGHTKYGDTSVVFPRATIDPEADPRNKVYGGDAWTPTKDNALVEREVNYEARRAFDENIKNLSSQFAGGVFQGSGTLGKIGLENETRWEPEEIADKLANHPEVQAAFLQSEGKSLEPVYRDKQFDRFFSNATIQRYLDAVGEQEVARLAVKLMTGERLTAEEMKPAEQAIREVYAEEHANFLNRRPESKEKRIDYYMENNVFQNRVEDFIRSTQEFYESGGSAGEIDKEATAAKMMEMIAPGGSWNDALRTVKDWVQPQLEGLLGERGIYNGEDTVTDSGRRSFAQTHWDYTAENIVKAMNMAAAKGANMYGVTPETLAATATREYRNVDEMHADEARLRTVSEEEREKALRDLGIYLDRVVNDLMLTTMHRYDNTFEEEQNLSGIIAEAAKGKKTTAAVKAAFRREGYAISDGHAKSILKLIDRAANIPTGYYEAKPGRVVPFEEAVAIVAPDSAPAEEVAAVKAATGANIIQYEAGNDAQRREIVNSLPGVRFSVDDEDEPVNLRTYGEEEQARAMERLTEDEQAALLQYKSSESYRINAKLRDGAPLTEQENRFVRSLDAALDKLPVHEGTVYRRLSFDMEGQEAMDAFLEEHGTGMIAQSAAYTSSSDDVDGYPVNGELTITQIIESRDGRDVAGIGNNFEHEILFARNARFYVDRIEPDADGKPVIYMEEVQFNAGDEHTGYDSEERGRAVRDMQEPHSAHTDVPGVPGADTGGDPLRGRNLQTARGNVNGLTRADRKEVTEYGTRQLYPEERSQTVQQMQVPDGENSDLQTVSGLDSGRGADRGGLPGVRGEGRSETVRYSAEEPEKKEKKPRKPKITKPAAESRPILAKQDLRQNMLNLFSIPAGMRAELGQYVDQTADRLLKEGALTQEDRDEFFDRMYESGVMRVEADEYAQMGRKTVIGRNIYVPEGVKHEFGDDWNEFRKRAFAAGVMLTNDRTDNGIDGYNMELAERLPGIFRADETDERIILERVVQIAEEGKDERMSLAEYTALLAREEFVSEEELLDGIERQMDWALRTFAEKAKLEIRLRDRTGVKIAQEREKYDERTQRERDREIARRAREDGRRRDIARRQKEDRQVRELQQKTLKQLQWLAKNRQRAPEELRGRWDDVLGDIDVMAARTADEMRWSKRYGATWGDLAQIYKDAQKNDRNFMPTKELQNIVNRLDKTKIADMDMDALQDLYKAAVGLRTEFYNRNNVISDETNRLFADVYAESKRELEAGGATKGAEKQRDGGKLDRLMNLEQLSPMNVMERMAGWNPESTFYAMARQLERGERDIRAYTVKANKQLRDFLTEHEDWVKRADGQGKDGIWYEIEVPELADLKVGEKPVFGGTVKVSMTPSQKVHMYLESKNYDNLRHMTGGRTFADRELYSQGKRREAFAQGKTVKLAPETVKALVKDLTPEEQELANALEQYYNRFAAQEINRVSNILYGYDKAVTKHYAPIYTNSNYTKSELGVYEATAEGVGNLKAREYSKNPSYNIGAFDAFERHVEQTARFVGMAIPARNWQTLLNWQEKNNSMADVISHTWGEESLNYIRDTVEKLQGGKSEQRDSAKTLADTAFSNYISAVFGLNPSIVLKQLGSIPLAAAWLDFRNAPSPAQLARIDRGLIERYTQELDWRTMGYATPETKQLKENPNWTQSNRAFAFLFGGDAITAMDGWAASALWPWAENKVRREHPELETGTQEQIDSGASPFYRKVAEEFNEAVARSQSTSDEMHQGTLRKSKGTAARAVTLFKSDSSQVYNALRQHLGEAGYYKQAKDESGKKGDRDGERRAGDGEKKARRAAGAVFLAAVGGYAWSQGIEFLINLWKHKGKAYQDEDGNLTAESVAREMVTGLMGDLAGIVTGGEEVFNILDAIGTKLTGGTWYDSMSEITAPGLEQVNDIISAIISAGGSGLSTMQDMADVVKNGGSLPEYLHRHGGDIIGGIKELAQAAATYLPGLSVNNLEAYLLGTVRWISPELATAYEDALATADRSGLKGLSGGALEQRIGDILRNRRIESDDETEKALAALYEAGYTGAVPGDTPGSVAVDGEDRTLNAYQQQSYDMVWSAAVGDSLKELTASDTFRAADDETREKLLRSLYEYAAEKAKSALFDHYEMKSAAEKADRVLAAGADMTDYLELKAAGAVDHYLKAVENGASAQAAKDTALALSGLEPEEGKKTVTDAQRWRAAIDAAEGAGAQREALMAVMQDKAREKYEIADEYGIEARTWVRLKEILPEYDADGNGSYTGKEIEAAIDALGGNRIMLPGGDGEQQLTDEMRAVLWQLFSSSTSAVNNPYSVSTGREVLEAKEKK